VLEGISGTGKDTQADHLKEMLEEHGHKVLRINEPTEVYKDLRSSLAPHELQIQSTGIADPVMNMFLLMADRYKIVTEQVIPALAEGTIVVSVRSFISTLVYQENLIYNPAFQAFAHNFVPPPDLVILYDVDPDIAFSRIQNRKRRLGFHEHPESLKKYRQKYVEVCESLPLLSYRLIYTGSSIETVWSETKKVAEECLPELFQTGSK
jgi:dTMP kinase